MGADQSKAFDAIIVVSFGGPEGPADVIPFLENVLRGKNVPRERMLAVAEHYGHFGGVSPLNAQNRALIAALEQELARHGPRLPVFFGNRNWHPLLPDTLRAMRDRGLQRALAFVTSAYSSYSGCRQYLEDIERAREAMGPGAPGLEKLRVFFNHPGFIGPQAELVQAALEQIPADRRGQARLAFTAHSIPLAMSQGCRYVEQLSEAARLVSERLGLLPGALVYQSRSGPPSQPWLEPDIGDHLRALANEGVRDVVVVPLGFLSDHIEILWDLDTEVREIAAELGMNLIRAGTVGNHPGFVQMIRELIQERIEGAPRKALGGLAIPPDQCAVGCCPSGRPPAGTRPAPGHS